MDIHARMKELDDQFKDECSVCYGCELVFHDETHVCPQCGEKTFCDSKDCFKKKSKGGRVGAEVMPKIDEYISWLQVFGYTVRINNHNIGDIHNITIERYEPLNKKKETFVKKHIDSLQLRLPSEAQKLFGRFEELLKPFDRINFSA